MDGWQEDKAHIYTQKTIVHVYIEIPPPQKKEYQNTVLEVI